MGAPSTKQGEAGRQSRVGLESRVDPEDTADCTHASKYAGREAEIMKPLTGDDGSVHFPSHQDQALASRLYGQWNDFNRHVMKVAGPSINGPESQRFSRLAFLHIVGHALAVDRLALKYERRNSAAPTPVGDSVGPQELAAAIIEIDKLEFRLRAAEDFLRSEGYERCDILACNCGAWHKRPKPGDPASLRRRIDTLRSYLNLIAHRCTDQEHRRIAERAVQEDTEEAA